MPIEYFTKLKEEYENIKAILKIMNCNKHLWIKCVDLTMVNFLFGLQSRYTKHPCFVCYWNSRDIANH